jgi:hypothetical protein
MVTNLADNGPGTLRQLISNSVAGDVLTFASNGIIKLSSGQLAISNNLTISGPGAANLGISAGNNPQGRVFYINSGVTASISGVTIQDGLLGYSTTATNGGGIYNAGTLALTGCVISNNTAAYGWECSHHTTGGNGGGIFNGGTLTMTNCTVTTNTAGGGGDICASSRLYGDLGGNGGGIFNSGTLTMANCTITANNGGTGGFGSTASSAVPAGNGGNGGIGGGIYNGGSLTLIACTVAGNSAGGGGNGGGGYYDGTVNFSGGVGGNGGPGGGIYNAGTLTVASASVSGNLSGGAGVCNGSGSQQCTGGYGGNGGNGAGIYNASILRMTNCTIAGNVDADGGSPATPANGYPGLPGNGGSGGGFYNAGTVALIACTVTGNSSGGGGVTPLTNGAAGSCGGFLNAGSGPAVIVDNSLVALNNTSGSGPDLLGSFTSLGHNLVAKSDGSAGFTNGVNGDLTGTTAAPFNPVIGPLTNNGDPTLTCALLAGSPALEAGDDSLTNTVATDQRGLARLSGLHVDIGAFEFDRSTVPAPFVSTLPPGTPTNNAVTATTTTTFNAMVNPGALLTTFFFQYGRTTNYGVVSSPFSVGSGTNVLFPNSLIQGLAPGVTYHYRAAITNNMGAFYGADQTVTGPLFFAAGDLNGDGVVDQNELNAVLSNYWPHSPWLLMTNIAGLGTTNVQFALPYPTAWNFTVEVSTNLASWSAIGSAYPLYQFGDAAATNVPQRYYRLRYP